MYRPTEFLSDDGGIEQTVARDRPTAVLFGNEHGIPSQVPTLPPEGRIEAQGIANQLPDPGERSALVQSPAGGLAEQLLVIGELQVHDGHLLSLVRIIGS